MEDQLSYSKAYAAALVAVVLYIFQALSTGDWTGADAVVPALGIVIAPFIVWLVPNK